jgi:hypothetical protein
MIEVSPYRDTRSFKDEAKRFIKRQTETNLQLISCLRKV